MIVEKRRPPAAGKGRPPGTLNKTTRTVKAAIEKAYQSLGGDTAFFEWAEENKDVFYTHLLPKLLPIQVEHKGDLGLFSALEVARARIAQSAGIEGDEWTGNNTNVN